MWIHWGNFQIGTYVSQNSTFHLANYGPQSKFQFLPSYQSNLSLRSIYSIGYWQNFAIGPILYSKYMFYVWANGKFPLFPSLLGMLAIKAMAFHEFWHLPHFVQPFMSYVFSNGKFLVFLCLFEMLAIKAMAFCEISLSSHQNLLFLKCVKVVNNLIPPSKCLHLSIYNLGTLGVKYTIFMQNAL